ncbi:MAG: Rv2578c family radical SAM protein [Nakamurella sp.]
MRWDGQRVGALPDDQSDGGEEPALPGMPEAPGLVRSVRPPDFAGITFHEVRAKSALNRVPAASRMPFSWTVNPYRGCTHACTYCFARNTHTYLELDPGDDFDRQIVVKVNVAAVLRRELARPSWQREQVALGTNTDPYQRAEGRYRLMPGIIEALRDSGTPFSILTKGTLLGRDLPLLEHAATRVPVGVGLSLALLDEQLQASLEPGTPSPRARLWLIRRIRAAGLRCGVLVAPLLPHLTDSQQQIDELVGELADAGVTSVSAIGLHLRPGTKDWFLKWLAGYRPDLVDTYAALYRRGAYLPADYRREIDERFRNAMAGAGLQGSASPEQVTSWDEHFAAVDGTTPRFTGLVFPGRVRHAGLVGRHPDATAPEVTRTAAAPRSSGDRTDGEQLRLL